MKLFCGVGRLASLVLVALSGCSGAAPVAKEVTLSAAYSAASAGAVYLY